MTLIRVMSAHTMPNEVIKKSDSSSILLIIALKSLRSLQRRMVQVKGHSKRNAKSRGGLHRQG